MQEVEQPANATVATGAGFGIRALGRIIDTVYGMALGLLGGFAAAIVLILLERGGLITPGWQARMKGLNLIGWGTSLLGTVIYHSLTEGMYGAALGKLICQLRVVRIDGRAATILPALQRSLAYFFDALFFGLVGYSAMKQSELNQRYGDRWAGTVVVPARDVPAASKTSGVLFVLAFLMGTVAWGVLLALGAVLHAL